MPFIPIKCVSYIHRQHVLNTMNGNIFVYSVKIFLKVNETKAPP